MPDTSLPHPTHKTHPALQRFWEFLLFLPPSVLMGYLIHVRQLRAEQPSNLFIWIADSYIYWGFWWLILPLLRRVAAKWSDQGKLSARHLIYHSLLSVPASFLNLAVSVYGSITVFREDPGFAHFWSQYVPTALRFLPVSMLMYATIVGILIAGNLRRKLREEQERTLQLREESTRSQLAALQGQVNPHFLFNTLNSLDVLIRSGQSAEASHLLHQLSDLLRTSLGQQREMTHSLESELRIVDLYLSIEQLRFSDRLMIKKRIDSSLLEHTLPAFALQTLVENAVRHGISRKVGDGLIEISAILAGNHLSLSVCDNGPGNGDGNTISEGTGVGLANLKRRLSLLYGRDNLLSSNRTADQKTEYRIDIPEMHGENRSS